MRGAFAIGALRALHDAGLTSKFDLAIANSSGAIATSYFLAGQSSDVDEGYWKIITDKKVFDPLRPHKIVDVDRMIDDVVFGALPLDVAALRKSATPLLVAVVDADARLPRYFVAQEMSDDELRSLLKATSALPGLFNGKIPLRGRRFIDGGFVDPLPVNRLFALDVATVVVVCTSPLEYGFIDDSLVRRSAIKTLSAGQSRFVRSWIGTPNPLHDENLERVLADSDMPIKERHVLAIAPEKKLPDFTRDAAVLHDAFEPVSYTHLTLPTSDLV